MSDKMPGGNGRPARAAATDEPEPESASPEMRPAEGNGEHAGKSLPLPPSKTFAQLAAGGHCVEPPHLVEGFLHRGDKLVLGAGSKSYKTFVLLDLALSINFGKDFLGWPAHKGRVLYVNLELHEWDMVKRIDAIAHAKGIAKPELVTLNLRHYPGRLVVGGVRVRLREAADLGITYDLVIVDPAYRLLAERDENSAGDMAGMLGELDLVADEAKSGLAYAHHFSKGNQSGKESIDRMSGSGAFARDADSVMTLTRLKQEGCYVVDTVLRGLPPRESFAVRWAYPLMRLAPDLDPADLKRVGGRPAEHSFGELLKLLPATGLSNETWIDAAARQGIGKRTYYRLRSKVEESGLIEQREGVWMPVQ